MDADGSANDDLEAIRRLAFRWTEAIKAADLGELEDLMSDDVVVVHGDGRVLSGRSAVLADFAASFCKLRLQQQATAEETVVDTAWAFERAKVRTSLIDRKSGKARRVDSRTWTILRRQPGGDWRVARVIGVVCGPSSGTARPG